MAMPKNKNEFYKLRDAEFGFDTFFNPGNGQYLRTGIIDQNGTDTGAEPFMSSFPHLLDIGVMGHCNHGLSGKCSATGNSCYQSGASKWQANMAFDDFQSIIDQSKDKVMQIALGGRGDPDQHESIENILAYSRENGIIPNMTTSGYELTPEKAKMMGQYCGAAAVSWYKTTYTDRAIDLLLQTGMKVNLHFVLSKRSIDEAIDLIENQKLPAGINRIVFLLYKPVGQGSEQNVLTFNEKAKYFFSLLDTEYGLQKMGFDSCCVPAVVNCTTIVDAGCYDACEAGRFSAYITPDMQFLPCSFDQSLRWHVSLRDKTLQEAWRSSEMEAFRQPLRTSCPTCPNRPLCMGGCGIKPSITLCDEPSRTKGVFDNNEIQN
jgi:radical SAM protein with 4Fe4S-binding SPASM domain